MLALPFIGRLASDGIFFGIINNQTTTITTTATKVTK
jgi:hypothetical protein